LRLESSLLKSLASASPHRRKTPVLGLGGQLVARPSVSCTTTGVCLAVSRVQVFVVPRWKGVSPIDDMVYFFFSGCLPASSIVITIIKMAYTTVLVAALWYERVAGRGVERAEAAAALHPPLAALCSMPGCLLSLCLRVALAPRV